MTIQIDKQPIQTQRVGKKWHLSTSKHLAAVRGMFRKKNNYLQPNGGIKDPDAAS